MVDVDDRRNQVNMGRRALAMCAEWVQTTQTECFSPNRFWGFSIYFDSGDKKSYKEYIGRLGFEPKDDPNNKVNWAFNVFKA
jgi:hypothetical protein